MSDKNYVPFHVHSDYSLLDSCTKFEEYVDAAVKNKQKAIAFTEHGNIYNWVRKKMYCDKNGIKYLHGVECYLTETHKEKLKDNYHTILIAKNFDGVLELNNLVSTSNLEDHFYYKPRLSFDEFLKISPNIIKISACLGSPLCRLDYQHPYYKMLAKQYDFYEIQPHLCEEQVLYNRHLVQLSDLYGKPLIAGTDTHNISEYKAECRSILQLAKGFEFSDEDAFDLTYKTYDELVDEFTKQDALLPKVFLKAIDNTNLLVDMVEDFDLDTSFKYPILYGTRENDAEMYKKRLCEKFQYKIDNGIILPEQIEKFKIALEEETRVFEKIDMIGFMLSMSEFVCWAKDNGIPVGFNRGSCGGSRVAYVLDIIDMNPETWHTVFSRFANENRKEIGDIDIDVPGDDRIKIYDYIINRFGQAYTSYILAIGTVNSKGTIDEIGRALNKRWVKEHGENSNSPYTLKAIAQIKKEFESDEDKTRAKYPELFYYYDGILDTKISQSVHPAGIIVSPITLADNYGTFIRDKQVILQIDMEDVHEVSLVKYDILGLKNITIINDVYKLLNKPYPKSHEINWFDENVWNDMLKSPVGCFQFESAYSHQLLKQFQPKSIFDMSLVTAALRPSGASYRNDLMARRLNKNPSPLIDDLLKDNYGFIIYQEDVLKFLQQICGLSGSDADNIRRAIGRKDKERLQNALPQILDGYCEKSDQPRQIAEEEAGAFLKILEDASSYMFGYNHSIGYCLIGYLCAYLRYYHPGEFITAFLNNANNENDIIDGTNLAKDYGIRIQPPRFGYAKDKYVYNSEEKIITKGIKSVKFLNKKVSDQMYKIAQEHRCDTFIDVLFALKKYSNIEADQLDILIKIDFFKKYGNIPELLRIRDAFTYFKKGDSKTISREKNNPYDFLMPKYATCLNAKGEELKSWRDINCVGLLNEYESHVKQQNVDDWTYRDKAKVQREYLGYFDLTTNEKKDRRKLYILEVFPLKNKISGDIWAYRVSVKSIGSGKTSSLTLRKRSFDYQPINVDDIIYATDISKNSKGYWYLNDYFVIE